MTDDALSLEGIEKRYGSVRALDRAALAVRRRTLHAVLGENGAGKTTLMRVAFGLTSPDGGVLRVDGTPRRFATPRDALAAGIGMVHQHFTIVPAMTVAENVALGGSGSYDPRAAAERVRAIGEATGLRLDPNVLAGTLGVAAQQRLEVLKALARGGAGDDAAHGGGETRALGTRLLILDEPAAVLAPAESEELLRWLRGWVDAGGTAVLVTHKLRDALRYADAVTVLRRGATVFAGALDRSDGSESDPNGPTRIDERTLTTAMLGESNVLTAGAGGGGARRASPPRDPGIARLAGVSVIDAAGVTRLRDATVDLRGGTVVGVAGVEGSGQHELLRVLAGRLAATTGDVTLPHASRSSPRTDTATHSCWTGRWRKTSRSRARARGAGGCAGRACARPPRRSSPRPTCAAARRRPQHAGCRAATSRSSSSRANSPMRRRS